MIRKLTFDRFMGEIDLEKYLKEIPKHEVGRLRYNPVSMLKTILFGFMTNGYVSLRELEDSCKVNLRFMYLMDHEVPSYRTFGYFINEILSDSIEKLFCDINQKFLRKNIRTCNIYILTVLSLKPTQTSIPGYGRKRLKNPDTACLRRSLPLFQEINLELQYTGIKFRINTEYSPEYLKEAASKYVEIWQLDETTFVAGKGHRKSVQQRHYEKLKEYLSKLNEYVEKIQICGDGRNSYSKTDHSATFMRIKKDYMGNDQLLPAYNVQVGVADEYIAVVDVNQYRSDMDCFIPLMNKFHDIYGFYPKYPVADAGYGSYNNYIFCEQNGLEKYMKFPMFKKETTDKLS